jgi:signal transduction histidine kinase
VPVADQVRIFDGFARDRGGGTPANHFGLGLPIVRAIAEAHHGHVTVDTASLGGARFTIRLPLSVAERT